MSGDLNRDIQSIQKVIHLFEHAHSRSEMMIDGLPALFGVIDAKGTLYRGNRFLGEVLAKDYEFLIGESLSKVFTPENWEKFQVQIQTVLTDAGTSTQFELGFGTGRSERSFLWYLLPLRHEFEDTLQLVTAFAIDVSELKATTTEKSRMESELQTAKAVQETLLPAANAKFENCTISGRYSSASECGGDIWYYGNLGRKVVICVADVMGHGASAALLASATRAVLSVDHVLFERSPAQILEQLNKTLCDLAKQLSFMTAVVGILDLDTGKFDYAYAAHEPFIWIPDASRQSGASSFNYCSSGPSNPLGSADKLTFKEESITLKPKDRLFFYTDGLFDMIDSQNNRLGPRRASNLLKKALEEGQTVAETADLLNQKVISSNERQPLNDDVTFVLMQYK